MQAFVSRSAVFLSVHQNVDETVLYSLVFFIPVDKNETDKAVRFSQEKKAIFCSFWAKSSIESFCSNKRTRTALDETYGWENSTVGFF
jgi:hypothetical protein